jgi:hypothetical protein
MIRGSQNWILNRNYQYRNASMSFVPLDTRLTPQIASASLQSTCLVHYVHGRGLPY